MSTGQSQDQLLEEKILLEEAKSDQVAEIKSLVLEESNRGIPLSLITQRDGENFFTVQESCVDSPIEEQSLREKIQYTTNLPLVHKNELKKLKLVKQQTLSDLPELSQSKDIHGRVLKKQNTVSGAISSEGKFSPCSLSSDGDRLLIRLRTSPGADFLSKCSSIYTSDKSLEKITAGSDLELNKRINGSAQVESDGGRSSGVGTSLVSLSGLGTSSAEGTAEHTVSRTRNSGTDFWSQVAQQVAFIDSSGNSNRSSLLLSYGHQIPPGVCIALVFHCSLEYSFDRLKVLHNSNMVF